MVTVWIPSLLRDLCGGERTVEVPGRTVRQVIDNLNARCPGIRDRLVDDGELRPELAVSVDGETTQFGLLEPVGEQSEVYILPALGGGAGPLPRPLSYEERGASPTQGTVGLPRPS